MPALTLPEFVAKWQRVELRERQAAQEHFIDLCNVLQHPTPAEADPEGSEFTFERGVSKIGGGDGWADVWKRGYLGWEYKGKHKDLDDAYRQLLQYREDLENPPLLVTCDLERFEVHTNFTNTPPVVYRFSLPDLLKCEPTAECARPPIRCSPSNLFRSVLAKAGANNAGGDRSCGRSLFRASENLRDRGVDPESGAHFLMRLLFCLFAEDVGLLPEQLFTQIVKNSIGQPGAVRE